MEEFFYYSLKLEDKLWKKLYESVLFLNVKFYMFYIATPIVEIIVLSFVVVQLVLRSFELFQFHVVVDVHC